MRKMGIGLGVGINRSNYAQGIFNAYSARVVADGGVVESGSCVDAVSSLLQSASLLLIPSGYKGGKLYAEIPTNGNGDLTWTRGGDAFRTNASGVLQRVPWNLLQYSEDLTNTVWFANGGTIVSNAGIAPNGTLTADSYTNSAYQIVRQLVTLRTSTTYTFSFYAKNVSATDAFYRVYNNTNATDVVFVTSYFSQINTSTWSRITLTFTTNTTGTEYGVYLCSGQQNGAILFWGAQLVEGTTAQTYLPTTDRLNFPRLSYMYGSCPSALLEPQRTNVETWSDDFSNAAWTKINCSITANATTSPDGSTNADKIIENSVNGAHFVFNATATLSVAATLSVYAKADTRTQISLQLGASSVIYNLSDGTIVAGSGGSIQSVGNGWYRCSITQTPLNTNALIYIANAGSSSYQGNGTSGLFIYGAQLEQGAYPTTYIPTTSATATRVADSAVKTGISSLIGQTEGVLFADFVVNGRAQNANILNSEKNTTSSFFLGARTDGAIDAGLYASGSFVGRITAGSVSVGQRAKVAYAYKSGNSALYINGVQVGISSGTFTLPSTLNDLFLNDTTTYFNYQESVSFNQVALFTTRLTNAQLATLTTI